MIEVIRGTDWSPVTVSTNCEFVFSNSAADTAQGTENKIRFDPYDYFPVSSSQFVNSNYINPINLGVYLDRDWNVHSTQFVGIMPLTERNGRNPLKLGGEPCVIKIDSRFHISPSEMLNEVLSGDDYYENPGMLQCNAYRVSELNKLFGKGNKNKVLCGTVSDIGKVTLQPGNTTSGKSSDDLEAFLSGAYPIFEIIQFVNAAKDICKKNLKMQSVFKEENLVGKVKGRILINKQIKQNISRGQYHKTYCAYNALSENIKENVIIKYALHLCSKFGIADSLREDIAFCNRVLANVPLKKCSASDFVGLKNNGVFRQYKQAMDAAKIIIKRYYISYQQSESGGKEEGIGVADYSVDPYFIDMNLLFEYYCRALFRKEINQYNNTYDAQIGLRMDPATRGNIPLFSPNEKEVGAFMKTYIPDILIRATRKDESDDRGTDSILAVIDAKYSNVEDSLEKRARTHQILFYMNVLNCNYGGLISPSDQKNEKRYHLYPYLFDGKNDSGKKLCYLPLWKEDKDKDKDKHKQYEKMVLDYLKDITEISERGDTDNGRQE